MSLAVLADHMASKGRGGDSMLIHMAPREIAGLQALAVANGSSLTTNPDTGLPEALSLKKLLPAIIGFGLNYFVPGLGSAVGSALGTSAAVGTGVAVGGFEALRTGDLGKGISAGLGAYGGAGLSEGLMAAGSTEAGLSSAALNAELAQAQGLPEGLSSGDAFNKFLTSDANPAVSEALKNATPFERMTAGLDAAKAAPGTFLKDNFKYLAAGAAPILADQAVTAKGPQTVTKPGMIRPYSYDPYGGTYTAGTPYEATPKSAAGGGLMGMNDGGYNPGQLDFTQRSEPVVRMANGGVPGYAPGGYVPTDTEIFNYFKTPGLNDAQIAADMQKFGVSAADIARATGTQGQQTDYEKRFVQTLDDPIFGAKKNEYADASDFLKATGAVGLQGQALTNAMQGAGLSAASQYALTHALPDTGGVTGTTFYKDLGYTAGALPGDQGGLEGLYANINYSAKALQDQINAGTLTVGKAQDLALAEANRVGVGLGDISAATGKTIGTLFTEKVDKKPVTCGFGMRLNAAGTACEPIVCGAGFQLNKAGTACEAVTTKDTIVGGTGNDTVVVDDGKTCGPGFTKSIDGKSCVPIVATETPCPTGFHRDAITRQCVPNINVTQNTTDTVNTPTSLVTTAANTLPVGVGGTTGPSIFGGGATVNPNGTITVSPVIPGIPVGGFTGMEQVRDAYEKGGGSLGVNKNLFAPKTLKEIEDRYKLTGGSKQAYDYLMGRTPYDPTPATKTGEIMKPYFESVGRAPINLKTKRYIFKDGKYELNPDYVKPSYVQAAEKKAADKTAADTKTTGDKATGTPNLTNQDEKPTSDPGSGNEWVWDYASKKWFASPIQVAAAGGLMAMARGGMSQQFDLGGYSDGGRLLRGPGDGVSDSIPATIGNKRPARLADGEFVVPARIVSELGNGSTEAGARKLYAMMDRIQKARRGTVGKGRVAKNSRSDKYLPA